MYSLEFKYCIFAILISFLICVLLSPIIIPILRKIKLGQYEREDGPQSHKVKAGTPTMGGVIILLAASIASLFFLKDHPDLIAIVCVTIGYGIIGFADDFIKVFMKRNLGLRAWQKIVGQVLVAGLFIYYLLEVKEMSTESLIPFTDGLYWDLG